MYIYIYITVHAVANHRHATKHVLVFINPFLRFRCAVDLNTELFRFQTNEDHVPIAHLFNVVYLRKMKTFSLCLLLIMIQSINIF